MLNAKLKAQELVNRYKTRDPIKLLEFLKYNLIEYPFSQRIKGTMIKISGQVVIGINKDLSKKQKIVTLAHELGHAQLHSGFGYYFILEHKHFCLDKLEIQANTFAAELLLGGTTINYGETISQFALRNSVPESLVRTWLDI